jgi:hypothetical protein
MVHHRRQATGANRNTIKAHLKNLADRHCLTPIGKGRGSRNTIE